MAKNYVACGDEIAYTNGGAAAIAAGDVVIYGEIVCVALDDIAIGATGAIKSSGVFNLAKLSTDAIGEGVSVYWDATNSQVTLTATANTLMGKSYKAAGAGTTTVDVIMNGLPD